MVDDEFDQADFGGGMTERNPTSARGLLSDMKTGEKPSAEGRVVPSGSPNKVDDNIAVGLPMIEEAENHVPADRLNLDAGMDSDDSDDS